MSNKLVSVIIAVIIIGATGALVFWQKAQKEDQLPLQETTQEQPTAQQGEYTFAQVASHSSQTDCWSVISGNVYDLTTWIPRHPGGKQAIESLCGKDGSAGFNAQHGAGAKQAEILATMKIGILK